jgi:hypothetical protein
MIVAIFVIFKLTVAQTRGWAKSRKKRYQIRASAPLNHTLVCIVWQSGGIFH